MGGRGKKRAFLKCKWPSEQQRFLSTGCLSGTALTQCRSHMSGTLMKMSLLPGLEEMPALPTEPRDEARWPAGTKTAQRETERSTPSLAEALCLQFKGWLKMSSVGHGLWHTMWFWDEPVSWEFQCTKRFSPQKGEIQENFSLWRDRKEGGRERRSFLFHRLFKEPICDTCTHFSPQDKTKKWTLWKRICMKTQSLHPRPPGPPPALLWVSAAHGAPSFSKPCTGTSSLLCLFIHYYGTRDHFFQAPKWLVSFH